PVADDHDLRALVAAGLVAFALHAPGRNRGLRGRGAALAAAVRMVDRVHGDAAHRGAYAAPAPAARLADRLQVVLLVADLADGRPAVDMNLADLTRAKPQLRIRTLAGEHLDVRARRAGDLRAFARHHLHAVHDGADRDIAQRQRIARLDRSLGARHELRADADAFRRDHVAPLAVGIKQQRQVGAAGGGVREALGGGRDAVP